MDFCTNFSEIFYRTLLSDCLYIYEKENLEDSGGIIAQKDIKKILLILMELGRVGQLLWTLVIIYTIF